jgi:G:T-mismatch repair DNA endonuclease (very short patch repair protein)
MNEKIVDIRGQRHVPPPATDFWFAQVDNRLERIEMMVRKLEWQVLLVVCVCTGGFILELISIFRG